MKIYIGFSKPTNKYALFGTLIRWIEARPYDHVYIRLPEPMTQNYLIFQASKEMVNLYNVDIFKTSNISLKEYAIEITDNQYQLLWSFVISNLGIPYSLLEDFGILCMKIFHLTKNPFNKGLSVEFCSQLGATICPIVGVNIYKPPSSIDPSLLDYILSQTTLNVTSNPIF